MVNKVVMNGYQKVKVSYDRALSFAPYAQAGVVFQNDGSVVLVSYVTPIIRIDADGWLECSGLYSRTTIKHIGCFLREYAPRVSYQSVKKIYNDGMTINIHTGEIREL